MTDQIHHLGARATACLLAVTLVCVALPAAADEPGPASLAPPAADAPQIEHFEYWKARGDAARGALEVARERLDEANRQVRHMQRRNHPRGEARVALRREQSEAREAWEAAVYHLEVELPDLAREAGADPRWLRDRS